MKPTSSFTVAILFSAIGWFVSSEVEGQIPKGFFTDVINVGPTGQSAFEFAPFVSADGMTLYFNEGPVGNDDMWMATRTDGTERFANVVSLGPNVNSPVGDDLGSVSPDGRTMYFGSNRDGNWDLYQATRATTDENFGDVVNLGPGVNAASIENSPRVSPNGLTMVFHVTADSELNDVDAWSATRGATDEQFGSAQRLDMNNESADDWWPSLSSDGLVLFTSDWVFEAPRAGGEGGEDIWVSTRPTLDAPFSMPVNVDELWPGSEVNSAFRSGSPYISPDWPAPGSKLYWTATGPGPISGSADIFQATWVVIPEPSTTTLALCALAALIPLRRRICLNQ